MRHQKSGRKFSRTSAHRQAMFENMAWRCALVRLNLRPDFWWRMAMFPS